MTEQDWRKVVTKAETGVFVTVQRGAVGPNSSAERMDPTTRDFARIVGCLGQGKCPLLDKECIARFYHRTFPVGAVGLARC